MNSFKLAIIDEVDNPASKVKVSFDGLKTDWIPLMQTANQHCKVFLPATVGEQVLVFWNAEATTGVAVRSFFSEQVPAPTGATDTHSIIEWNDGTRITYDHSAHSLTIKAKGDVQVHAQGKAEVMAKQVELGANQPLDGVVTKQCKCAFTGAAHPEASTVVFAKKE